VNWGTLRLMQFCMGHEGNGSWYPWSFNGQGVGVNLVAGSIEAERVKAVYRETFRIVQEELVSKGRNVWFGMNFALGRGGINAAWTGSAYNNVVPWDAYDAFKGLPEGDSGHLDTQAKWDAWYMSYDYQGNPRGLGAAIKWALDQGLPWSLPEHGLSDTDTKSDNALWMKNIREVCRAHAPVDPWNPGPGELLLENLFSGHPYTDPSTGQYVIPGTTTYQEPTWNPLAVAEYRREPFGGTNWPAAPDLPGILNATRTSLNALRAEIAALRVALGVKDSRTKPAMGLEASSESTFNTINAAVGGADGVRIRRTYRPIGSALPANFAASEMATDFAAGRASYWGWHPDPTTFPTDLAAQGALSTFLDTVPVGHTVYFTAKHEPEGQIQPSSGSPLYSLVQYGNTMNKVGQIIRGKNRPELRFGPTFQGPWTFDSRSGYLALDWLSVLDMSVIDFVGLDPYRSSDGSAATWEQMMTVGDSGTTAAVKSTMATMVEWGKPVLFGEFGAYNKNPLGGGTALTDTQLIGFIDGAYTWAKKWNPTHPVAGHLVAMIYFNQTLTGSNQPLTAGARQDAYAAIIADSKS